MVGAPTLHARFSHVANMLQSDFAMILAPLVKNESPDPAPDVGPVAAPNVGPAAAPNVGPAAAPDAVVRSVP